MEVKAILRPCRGEASRLLGWFEDLCVFFACDATTLPLRKADRAMSLRCSRSHTACGLVRVTSSMEF